MIHTLEFKAMGSHMLVALESDSPKARQRLAQVPEWFEEWEQSLSRFRPESELSRLNRLAGRPMQVSPTLAGVFQTALEAESRSGGLVTPLVLNALVAAGYDRSFDQIILTGEVAPQTMEQAVPPRSTLGDRWSSADVPIRELIEWDAPTRMICLPEGLGLDFGGVAKGWAAHQAMLRLRLYGPALVDAGGDIAISGLPSDGPAWQVGIADPHRPDAQLGILHLGRCGVATSGVDYRRWQQAGAWRHHLIDPHTARPAETDLLSVTVIASTVMEAEMAAKLVLISGSQAGLGWLEENPTFSGLLVLQNGRRLKSSRFRADLH